MTLFRLAGRGLRELRRHLQNKKRVVEGDQLGRVVMSKLRTVVARGAAILAALGVSALAPSFAQSNALLSDSPGEDNLGTLIADGWSPIHPDSVIAFLSDSGFTIIDQERLPSNRYIVTARAPNGLPFVYEFIRCGREGCMFLEMISLFGPEVVQGRLNGSDLNVFNRANPIIALTLESTQDIAVRYKFPALNTCSDVCQESAMQLFFNGVRIALDIIDRLGSSAVEVRYDGAVGAELAAAFDGAPTQFAAADDEIVWPLLHNDRAGGAIVRSAEDITTQYVASRVADLTPTTTRTRETTFAPLLPE